MRVLEFLATSSKQTFSRLKNFEKATRLSEHVQSHHCEATDGMANAQTRVAPVRLYLRDAGRVEVPEVVIGVNVEHALLLGLHLGIIHLLA